MSQQEMVITPSSIDIARDVDEPPDLWTELDETATTSINGAFVVICLAFMASCALLWRVFG